MIQVPHGRVKLCSKGLKLVTCVSSRVVRGSEPGHTSSIKELSQEDGRFAATGKLQASFRHDKNCSGTPWNSLEDLVQNSSLGRFAQLRESTQQGT